MFTPVDTKNPAAVEAEVNAAYLSIFPHGDPTLVPRVFECVTKCFRGQCAEYQAIDAGYHDLEHTLQGTLCLARLLSNRDRAGVKLVVDLLHFQLGLLAILLHDTGYAKHRGDTVGTGAKFTFTHVDRSARFAAVLLGEHGFTPAEIRAVQNMIRCTGLHANLDSIPFQDPLERLVGSALATADLLGQMAAPDYVDKLPMLFREFAEAAAFNAEAVPLNIRFTSAEELMDRTPDFWQDYVLVRINGAFGGLYHFLEDPYPGGPNEYLLKIYANLARIQQRSGSPAH